MRLRIDRNGLSILVIAALVLGVMVGRYRTLADLGDFLFPFEMIIAIMGLYIRRNEKKSNSFLFYLYIAFLLYRLVICWFWSGGHIVGESKLLIYRELGIALAIYCVYLPKTEERIILFIRNFGAINALLGSIEFAYKESPFSRFILNTALAYSRGYEGTSLWRVRTLFFHPIICAVFITISWIVLLYYPYKRILLNNIVKLLLILSLVGTKSRSSWASFVLINLIYLVIRWKKSRGITSRNSIYVMIAAIALLIAFGIAFWDNTLSIISLVISRWASGFDRMNAGNYNRVSMIKLGIQELKDASLKHRLFGYGADFAIKYLRSHPIRGWSNAVDNSYVTCMMNYGIVGLTLFLAILLASIRSLVITNIRSNEMASLGIISIFVSGFFYDIFGWFTSAICLCLLLIMQYYEKE